MKMSNLVWARVWIFGLVLLTLTAALLVVSVNPFEIAIAYLVLLAVAIAVGLITNIWGGLLASALSVFAVIALNQYSGIYPRENLILNIATELAVVLMVGPVAGTLSTVITREQRRMKHWLTQVEKQSLHDEDLGTLKMDWAKVRLEAEIQRAKKYSRPLTVALLQVTPTAKTDADPDTVLRALARITMSQAEPPSVVSRIAEDQLALVLPEHTLAQAEALADKLQTRFSREAYLPAGTNHLQGEPIGRLAGIRIGLAELNGQAESAEALLTRGGIALLK